MRQVDVRRISETPRPAEHLPCRGIGACRRYALFRDIGTLGLEDRVSGGHDGEPTTVKQNGLKQVTVLFADVVGSMKIAAVLQTERLREIMNELFNRAAAVVQRYQGTVDKFTGDGLMALFGAPVAPEDHALRACISATEIQSVAQKFADEVFRRGGIRLQVRVGLNSGEVIAGEIGSGPGRYKAVGHPVGMAPRLRPPGPRVVGQAARMIGRMRR
jgi:class 3 adenylate cyclase